MSMPLVSEMDYNRLSSLFNSDLFDKDEKALQELEFELDQAEILKVEEVPENLITMNTRFCYLNVTDGKICEMTIVYPQHTDLAKRWISVTAPLGAAFLGLKTGDEVKWEFPDGKMKTLKVLNIIYQPESFGDYHL